MTLAQRRTRKLVAAAALAAAAALVWRATRPAESGEYPFERRRGAWHGTGRLRAPDGGCRCGVCTHPADAEPVDITAVHADERLIDHLAAGGPAVDPVQQRLAVIRDAVRDARPSHLTDEQWAAQVRRLLRGPT